MIKRNQIIEQIKNRIAYHSNNHKYYYELGKGVIDYFANDIYADFIQMGGLLPPVNVGDKVYTLGHGNRKKPVECEVVFIGISADDKCSYFNFVQNRADGTFYKSYSMVFGVIGKTVFLTKEEAEKALLERAADNGR